MSTRLNLKNRRSRTLERKRALLIGVSYAAHPARNRLKGSINGAKSLKLLLIEKYGYSEEDIVMLCDDDDHSHPTKENILRAMTNLVKDVKKGDKLVFHFSGHGAQVECTHEEDLTEVDGKDEAIIPCDGILSDVTGASWILDDVLNKVLVQGLPVGSQLTAIFDMCHSGTALDLEHYNETDAPWRTVKASSKPTSIRQRFSPVNTLKRNSVRIVVGKRSNDGDSWPSVSWDVWTASDATPRRLSLHDRGSGSFTHQTSTAVQHRAATSPSSKNEQNRLIQLLKEKIHWFPSCRVVGLCSAENISETTLKPTEVRNEWHANVHIITGSPTRTSRSSSLVVQTWDATLATHSPEHISSPINSSPELINDPERAQVFSISACADGQDAYENPQGDSLTSIIVEILSQNPHPSYRTLMRDINQRMWEMYCAKRLYEMKREDPQAKEVVHAIRPGAGDEVQEPQLGSHKKMNMDDIFTF